MIPYLDKKSRDIQKICLIEEAIELWIPLNEADKEAMKRLSNK